MISNQNNATKQASNLEKEIYTSRSKNSHKSSNHSPENHHCISCSQTIHHPLCPDCIAKGYFEWTKRIPGQEFDKTFHIRERIAEFLEKNNSNNTTLRCVSCNKKRTNICPLCFADILHKITKEAGVSVKILSEFLFMFNFDFEHKVYRDELESYGGY